MNWTYFFAAGIIVFLYRICSVLENIRNGLIELQYLLRHHQEQNQGVAAEITFDLGNIRSNVRDLRRAVEDLVPSPPRASDSFFDLDDDESFGTTDASEAEIRA